MGSSNGDSYEVDEMLPTTISAGRAGMPDTGEGPEGWKSWWGPTNFSEWKDEFLASVVVCFAQIPASVAFAALANVNPAVGLHAAWIVGLVCAVLGGRPGMINGAAGALASVTCNFVTDDGRGVEELFVSVIVAGLLVMVAAWFDSGRFLSLVPMTVMIGFCNGLAIVIGHAQLDWFTDANGLPLQGAVFVSTLVHCVIAFFIMLLLPRLTKRLPASLLAIAVGCMLEHFLFRGYLLTPTVSVGDKSNFPHEQAIPRPFFLNSLYDLGSIRSLNTIATQGATLALVAILESLMTMEVVNDKTGTSGFANQQLWALGLANVLAGLFGTMGGNALIELSVMNVQAGGTRRASSTFVALGVLAIVLVASPVLNMIPAGSLAGIMVLVVLHTAKWSSLPAVLITLLPEAWAGDSGWLGRCCHGVRIQRYDAFVIVLVTVTTALTNLAFAVFLGMFFSSMRFVWQLQQPLEIRVEDRGLRVQGQPPQERTYTLVGNVFFASKDKLVATFRPDTDPDLVTFDFAEATVLDSGVLMIFRPILDRYAQLGKRVRFANMHTQQHLRRLLSDEWSSLVADHPPPGEGGPDEGCGGDGSRAGGIGGKQRRFTPFEDEVREVPDDRPCAAVVGQSMI